jgi:hypothetical protein
VRRVRVGPARRVAERLDLGSVGARGVEAVAQQRRCGALAGAGGPALDLTQRVDVAADAVQVQLQVVRQSTGPAVSR